MGPIGISSMIFFVCVASPFRVYFGGLCFSVKSRSLKEIKDVSPMLGFARMGEEGHAEA